ncbi:unnamed protein product [Mytilus edulis]|uniref:Uncharacterized protein n=1 Tax=Mytilus edulis TaxID=6550 RepID=A0A8S3PP93_MYTED|nr:unnamed protein product [Mytilus edulis]
MLDNDSSNSDELCNTAQPIETDSATEAPAELISKKDEAPPLHTKTSSPKGPASSVGAEEYRVVIKKIHSKKSESTAEIRTPAQMVDNDSSNSDELGNTAQPIETDSATDAPAELISKKDEAPPLHTKTSSPKVASSVGADCKSTTGRERKERRRHKKGEIKIQKKSHKTFHKRLTC